MLAMVLHFASAALNGSRRPSFDEAQTAAICANQSSALHAVKKRTQPNTFDLMFTTITLASKTSNAEYVTNQGRKQRTRLTKRTTKHFAVFNAAEYTEHLGLSYFSTLPAAKNSIGVDIWPIIVMGGWKNY